MELGPQNIRVNGIVPGNVNGERMDRVVQAHAEADKISPEVVRKLYAIGTSLQCFIEPEEIANMILFLSSDLANYYYLLENKFLRIQIYHHGQEHLYDWILFFYL